MVAGQHERHPFVFECFRGRRITGENCFCWVRQQGKRRRTHRTPLYAFCVHWTGSPATWPSSMDFGMAHRSGRFRPSLSCCGQSRCTRSCVGTCIFRSRLPGSLSVRQCHWEGCGMEAHFPRGKRSQAVPAVYLVLVGAIVVRLLLHPRTVLQCVDQVRIVLPWLKLAG